MPPRTAAQKAAAAAKTAAASAAARAAATTASKKAQSAADKIKEKLDNLDALLATKVIDADQCRRGKNVILGIADVVTAGATTAVAATAGVATLEEEGTRNRRETKKLSESWIGPPTAPALLGELWDVMVGGCAGDETFRQEMDAFKSLTPLHRELWSAFKDAGKGKVPDLEKKIATLAAAEWLRGLAAAFGAHVVIRVGGEVGKLDRKRMRDELYDQLDVTATASDAATILASISKAITAKNAMVSKLTVGETPTVNSGKGGSGGGGAGSGAVGDTSRVPHPKPKFPSLKCSSCAGIGHLAAACKPGGKRGKCARCGGKGHFAMACPSVV